MHKALVETKKASSVFGFDFQWHDPTLAIFGAEVRQGDSLEAAKDVLISTIEGIGANPPTKEEVERARAQLLKTIELTLNNSDRVGLTLELSSSARRLAFVFPASRPAPQSDAGRSDAGGRALFQARQPHARAIHPHLATGPRRDSSHPGFAGGAQDYKGDATVAAGEAFDPSPANIEARTMRSEAGGIKLALLPKKTRGGKVVAQMALRYGDEKSLMNRTMAARLAGPMLMRGTAKHSRQQIQDET